MGCKFCFKGICNLDFWSGIEFQRYVLEVNYVVCFFVWLESIDIEGINFDFNDFNCK